MYEITYILHGLTIVTTVTSTNAAAARQMLIAELQSLGEPRPVIISVRRVR